jgi:hypothetical protein
VEIDILKIIFSGVVPVAAIAAAAVVMLRYLQRGDRASKESPDVADLLQNQQALKNELRELEARLRLRPHQQGAAFTQEDKQALLDHIEDSLREEGAKDILERIEKRIAEAYPTHQVVSLITAQATQTIERLRQEVFALSRRGNLNLVLGITTAITGLTLLGWFVVNDPALRSNDVASAMIAFVPRLSLVVLIEVFAYFFLRLYKAGLSEIKYFQNEITSIEAKLLALMVAAVSGNELVKTVIEHLAKAERNFILEKGQTTVELERSRLEQEGDATLLEKFTELMKKKG